ncbi:hypothetical protein O9929_19310 [Vibrio lentus]|nr:hypothetical protein [Vibrio lentus]
MLIKCLAPVVCEPRGSILDLFLWAAKTRHRIDFFDDEIDTIRTFDPENQRSIEDISRIVFWLFGFQLKAQSRGLGQQRQQFDARKRTQNLSTCRYPKVPGLPVLNIVAMA